MASKDAIYLCDMSDMYNNMSYFKRWELARSPWCNSRMTQYRSQLFRTQEYCQTSVCSVSCWTALLQSAILTVQSWTRPSTQWNIE